MIYLASQQITHSRSIESCKNNMKQPYFFTRSIFFRIEHTNAKSQQEVDIVWRNMNKKLAGIVVGATIVVVAGIVRWIIHNKERGR